MSCDCGPFFFFYLVTGKRGMNKWNEVDLAFLAPDSQTDGLRCSATAIKASITSATSLTRAPSKEYSADLSTSFSPLSYACSFMKRREVHKCLSKESMSEITSVHKYINFKVVDEFLLTGVITLLLPCLCGTSACDPGRLRWQVLAPSFWWRDSKSFELTLSTWTPYWRSYVCVFFNAIYHIRQPYSCAMVIHHPLFTELHKYINDRCSKIVCLHRLAAYVNRNQ